MPTTMLEEDPMMGIDDSSFADFLKDIMMPSSDNEPISAQFASQDDYTRDFLDIGVDFSFDLPEVDFGIPGPPAERPSYLLTAGPDAHQNGSGTRTPDMRNSISLG